MMAEALLAVHETLRDVRAALETPDGADVVEHAKIVRAAASNMFDPDWVLVRAKDAAQRK